MVARWFFGWFNDFDDNGACRFNDIDDNGFGRLQKNGFGFVEEEERGLLFFLFLMIF